MCQNMTIDINLSEFQYLADHLHSEECRRLVAALHFKSYEQPNALDQAERKISKDVSCLNALLHWNSAAGEGKGETHEVLEHRLRQLGRYDLADWLGKTVFHQLSEDLRQNLNDSFKEFLTEKQHNYYTVLPTEQAQETLSDPTEWLAIDTVLYVAAVLLFIATVAVLTTVMCKAFCKKIKQKQTKKKDYFILEDMDDESDDSDTVYDASKKDKYAMTESEL